ncbi:MAG: hypothetical protein WAS21_33345 [Geminicoccaceae bacterium]
MTKPGAANNGMGRRRLLRGGVGLAGSAVAQLATSTPSLARLCLPGGSGQQALMADSVADAPGVNTHINYLRTIYDTGYASIVKPRLLELGIRHIRDNPGGDSDARTKGRYIELARSGIRLLLCTWSTADQDIDYVKSLNGSGVRVVEAVEPPNERDNAWGTGMPAQMRSYMQALYARYKSDTATRSITILGPSFANTKESARRLQAAFSDAAKYMDCGNVHSYCGRDPEGSGGGGYGISLSEALTRQRMGSTKAVWASENGYKMSRSSTGHPAVTQRAAAKYVPRQILSHMLLGAPRLYGYQLINNNAEDFALLNSNGSPRLQFTALKNLIALFKDPGAAFVPDRLAYTLSGVSTGIQQMLFQKRDGRFYLAVWQGVLSSSLTSSDSGIRDVEPARRALTFNLGTKVTSARIYEPSLSSSPVKTYASASGIGSIPLSVPDHVQVIELVPLGCSV